MLLYIGGTKIGKSTNILLISKCGGNPAIRLVTEGQLNLWLVGECMGRGKALGLGNGLFRP